MIAAMIDKSEQCEAEESQTLKARIALLTPVFKGCATERGNLMAGTTIQIFGGMGFVEETGVAQLMRDARANTIYEGTTGIQARDLVFRKVQLDKGAALTALLEDIDAVAARLAESESLASLAEQLSSATSQMRSAIDQITDKDNADQLQLNAGGVPFMDALGTLCCAWQLADIALTAEAKIAQGDDSDYHTNLVALAEFYFSYSVPNIEAGLKTFNQAHQGVGRYRFDL